MNIISGYVEVHVFRRSLKNIEYLLLKRGEQEIYPGLWQMVTGKIRENEKAYETALREIYEETGCRPLNLWTAPRVNHFYSSEKDAVYVVPVFAAELDASAEITICKEHCEYVWAEPSRARELFAWEEQKQALDVIRNYILKLPVFFDLVKIKL